MTPFEMLHAALDAEVGLSVKTDDPTKLRLKIYAERQKQQKNGFYEFDEISIFELPENELWIIRHDVLRRWRDGLEREQDTPEI